MKALWRYSLTAALLAASLGAALAGVGAAALAQGDWAKKPFEEWSKKDAEEVLNKSPWAASHEVKIKYAAQSQAVAGAPNASFEGTGGRVATEENTASLGGANAPIDFTFTLRLRSALPVRQALVRLKQLEAKGGKGGDKDRAAFDARMKGLLECPACADNYVLTLSSRSRNAPGADAVFQLFKGGRLDDLRRYIALANDRGERRPLVHFVAPKVPGDEATFFFPRFDDRGAPLFTTESKRLILNLTNNEVNAITNFTIDVSRLVVNGKVEF